MKNHLLAAVAALTFVSAGAAVAQESIRTSTRITLPYPIPQPRMVWPATGRVVFPSQRAPRVVIDAKRGSKIVAPASGRMRPGPMRLIYPAIQDASVVIDHERGYRTLIGGVEGVSRAGVVKKGQRIARASARVTLDVQRYGARVHVPVREGSKVEAGERMRVGIDMR